MLKEEGEGDKTRAKKRSSILMPREAQKSGNIQGGMRKFG